MTARHVITRKGSDEVPEEAARFLRDHVPAPDGPPSRYVEGSVGLMLAGAADQKALRRAVHGLETPPTASPVVLAVAKARGIDLAAWALLAHWHMSYRIQSPFTGGDGCPAEDSLLPLAGGGVCYDIAIGDGASWMESPQPNLVLDPRVVGFIPETAVVTMQGRLLRDYVSNAMLDPLDLVVWSVSQDEWVIEIETVPLRRRYVLPTSAGRVFPVDGDA